MTSAAVRPVAVKRDQDIRERIKRLADSHQCATHWMMREAIEQYVEREEKREAFRQEGLRAWSEYHSTSRSIGTRKRPSPYYPY